MSRALLIANTDRSHPAALRVAIGPAWLSLIKSTKVTIHRRDAACGFPSLKSKTPALPELLMQCSRILRRFSLSYVQHSFSAPFSWALLRANSCARQLRVLCFLGSALDSIWVPSHKADASLRLHAPSLSLVPQRKRGRKKGKNKMSYLNSVTLVGFVGADPEQRQAKGNGSKFTVLSVATQRSWKNAEDEWVSKVEWHRVAIFRPRLAEAVLTKVKKGAHVLIEGSLVSSTYEQANGKAKKAKTNKQTFWCIRADVVRKLDRGEPEPEPETVASRSATSSEALDASDPSPF